MGLTEYNQKRQFGETPEPKGKEKSLKGALRFVVQKHDASSLHYDFRLEMDGVLKSWAVPKGPSLNTKDKRLAMAVEDHPLDYRNFEGIIPENNYGAGTVMVWDEGTYEPADMQGLTRKEQEKHLLQQLTTGSIKIVLHGSKLQGSFNLFQMKGRGDATWMLVKRNDLHASEDDVLVMDQSVKTGKTLAEIAAENGVELNHPEEGKGKEKKFLKQAAINERAVPQKFTDIKNKFAATRKKLKPSGNKIGETFKEFQSKTKQTAMPDKVVPMLATLIEEPFDDRDWIFEIKWDGYRAIAHCMEEKVELVSRNLSSFTGKYIPVAEALKLLKLNAVFDGEIVAVDESGLANFQMLQNWQNTPARLQFFVFDVLWLNGYDVTQLPLVKRKKILQEILPADNETIRYSDHVVAKGQDFFRVALEQGLEGIMAKRAGSIYTINARSKDWVKIKVNLRQEVVIAGFTAPRNSRQFFGSLLLGVYQGDDLVYVGHTGSGFNKKSLELVYNKLQPLIINESPFTKKAKANMPVTWVKPKLVCEIKFTEWTKDGIARHPIFMGLRSDKKAREVILEKATTMAGIKSVKQKTAVKQSVKKDSAATSGGLKKKSAIKQGKISGIQLDVASETDQTVVISKQELKLTNLQKPYWKKEGFAKGDMINYYLRMAPYMLPYLLDRPHSLNRHPNGVGQPNFFQKDVRGKVPDWITKHEDFSESTNQPVEYLVCSNEATLIFMANMGCIEINPWHSRTQSWRQPDWCLIDLDPDKGNSFEQVMETALVTKKILDAIGANGYVKTSGSTGIHIYIPLGGRYSFEQSKMMAELIVTLVNKELPELTSTVRNPAKRKGKIYLDFMQNAETQTAAAPYSLRPKPGVPVSTPLDWSELKKGLKQTTWNARNIFERLQSEGDLFAPVLKKGINLEKVLSKLEGLK